MQSSLSVLNSYKHYSFLGKTCQQKVKEMGKSIKCEAVDRFFEAVLSLKSTDECYNFFEDVCTVNELRSISQRFEVAKMLHDGHTYLDIADKTGASTATIGRVNRTISGGTGGYEMVIERIKND